MTTTEKYTQRVKLVIAEQLGTEEHLVTPEKALIADLGADSLDSLELVMALEDEFGIEIEDLEADAAITVAQTIALVLSKCKVQAPPAPPATPEQTLAKENARLERLRVEFEEAHRAAIAAAHALFAATPEGPARTRAAVVYENIRTVKCVGF